MERVSREWRLTAFHRTRTSWHQTSGWQVKKQTKKRGLSKQTKKRVLSKNTLWNLLAALPQGRWGFTQLRGKNEHVHRKQIFWGWLSTRTPHQALEVPEPNTRMDWGLLRGTIIARLLCSYPLPCMARIRAHRQPAGSLGCSHARPNQATPRTERGEAVETPAARPAPQGTDRLH